MRRKKQQKEQTGQPDDLRGAKTGELPDEHKTIRQPVSYYVAGAVSFLTLVVYLPALRNGFVTWDDNLYVYENAHIQSLNWAFFKWAFTDLSAGFWHPITWISYAVDYALWGLNPLGYHLTAILLHAINTFLVVCLVGKLIEVGRHTNAASPQSAIHNSLLTFHGSRFALIAAGVTGLLFGIHPLHVESVAWVAERKDLLCALFFLLSIIAYMDYVSTMGKDVDKKVSRQFYMDRRYLLSLAFFILALSAKTMAVTLPVVLLVLDWYPLRRIQSMKSFIALSAEKIPFIASSLLISIVSIVAQKSIGALTLTAQIPLSVRVPVAFKALVMYLWKIVVPVPVVPYYPYPQNAAFLSIEYLFAIAFVIGLGAASGFLAKKHPIWLSLSCYFAITLLPVLGIIQVGGHFMADRYTYLPGLAPFLIAGLASARFLTKSDTGHTVKRLFASVAIVLVVSLSYVTVKQIAIWKTSIDLWNYVIEKEPGRVPLAYNNRGVALKEKGLLDQAIDDYNTAIALNQGYAHAYNNRGLALKEKGLLDLAIGDYTKAITLDPGYALAYSNRGAAFKEKGYNDRAIDDYSTAIKLNPDNFDAYINLAVLSTEKELADKALKDLMKQ
jgi:tetratricopeptide (TPR) repeat protein